MKICLIGKITPIQGGVSRQNFWLAYALAKCGHEVHLVTNANEVEEEYRLIGGRINKTLNNTPLEDVKDNLTIHFTHDRLNYSYIPYANPYVSKLTSKAVEIVRKYKCDIILAYYFEPYGVSAYFTSNITKVPFGLRHAGSDVGRLLRHPDLNYLYKDMIRQADFIFCSRTTGRRFMEMGVDHEKLSILSMVSYPSHIYNNEQPCLDLESHMKLADEEMESKISKLLREHLPVSNYKKSLPTIGIYGKVAKEKGSFDLISALGKLKQQGLEFNFLALCSGKPKVLHEFKMKILEAGIQDMTTWLPFVPHWDIPQFIKVCDAVCFLERDFSIPIHRPGVAMEVMLCGGCLVVSNEIADKQSFCDALIDEKNALVVDPTDINALSEKLKFVISDTNRAHNIGAAGRLMLKKLMPDFDQIIVQIGQHLESTYERVKSQELEMSIIEYQSFINRLYTDEIFRKLNDVSPAEAESIYQLTTEEKNLLKKLDKKMIAVYSESLKGKSMTKLRGMYPLLSKSLKDQEFVKHFSRYYSINSTYPGEEKISLNDKFGYFMEQSVIPEKNYLSELARFERIRNNILLSTTPEDSFEQINERKSNLPIDINSHISINPSVKIIDFDWDIDSIVNALNTDDFRYLEELSPREITLVIYSIPNEFKTKTLKVNKATASIIKLAKKESGISTIIDLFETNNNLKDTTQKVIDLMNFLMESGIVRVRKKLA
ncbi:glycosyltransferase family 4 protein [Microbulbifer sp. ZKSA004]|uniref:glycosyltransferase family 4 protein n=1 Tax=Microbulbifer sp. ZKSA004 TaxID=3243389 RepID=UPI0040396678